MQTTSNGFVFWIHNSRVFCIHHTVSIWNRKRIRETVATGKKEWKKQKLYRAKHSNETLTFTCPQGLLCNKSRGLIFIQIESVCCFAPVWRGWSQMLAGILDHFLLVWDNGMHCIIVLFSCLCFRGWFGSKWKIVKGFSDIAYTRPVAKLLLSFSSDVHVENNTFRPVEPAIGFSMNVYVYQTLRRVYEDHFLTGPPCRGCSRIFSTKMPQLKK